MDDLILFKAIVGSQSYGTSIPESDIDYKGVYRQSNDKILSFGYKPQYEIGKDEVHYEIRRFLELIRTANPTILELLYSPDDCIIVAHPIWNELCKHKDKFLTKKCRKSFGGYAISQIQKATQLDKKMNWESSRVERKTPLDFTYVCDMAKTVKIERWLEEHNWTQDLCGLVALDHAKGCYGLYYDVDVYIGLPPIGFRGIISEDGNDIRVSIIPKGILPEKVTVYFNKDAYSAHCADYNSYQIWLKERNEARYVDNKGHNQKIDGKNMLHCRRLLDIAKEIATEGTINVRRPNADYLLQIRRGEIPLQKIVDDAENDIEQLDFLFEKSNLPDTVEDEFLCDLLLSVRNYQ